MFESQREPDISILCRVIVNECTCEHGVAQSGVHCPARGAAKCKSCNTGWIINRDRTKCICTCTRIADFRNRCSFVALRTCSPLFAVKRCGCKNGVAETGARCRTDGAANCKSCNAGYKMNKQRTECISTFALCSVGYNLLTNILPCSLLEYRDTIAID